MYVNVSSKVEIGQLDAVSVSEISLVKTVKELSDKAVIKIPRKFNKKNSRSIKDLIKVGDVVAIYIGYNGEYCKEFTGYVSNIGDGTPITLECDDEWFLFKKNRLVKSWKSVTLKEVIQFAMPGYTVTAPAVELGKYQIDNVSSYKVLSDLRENIGFHSRLDVANKRVDCWYPFDFKGYNTHTYVFGTRNADLLKSLERRNLRPNVKRNDLVFETMADLKLQIEARSPVKVNGKRLTVTVGNTNPEATKRTRNYGYECDSVAKLKAKAEAELKTLSLDGYSGTITGFGRPATDAGDTIVIVDPENSEREGKYLVESVTVKYSPSTGYERTNKISYKV